MKRFKKVLVTGAHGFVGANLCRELLARGYEIRGLVKSRDQIPNIQSIAQDMELVEGDVRDVNTVRKAVQGIDVIFHAATASSVVAARKHPSLAAEVNVVGTLNVATSAIESNVQRFIHISTNHVFGNPPPHLLPFNENTNCFPQDMYSASRYAAELLLKPLIEDGMDIVITRAFNHYGPYQSPNNGLLIPAVIKSIFDRRPPLLNDPSPTRDYSHVFDIVRGYISAAEHGDAGDTYIFASGMETSVGNMTETLIRLAAQNFGFPADLKPIYRDQRSHDLVRSCGDASLAKKKLAWSPTINLEVGLLATLEWWREQLEGAGHLQQSDARS